MKICLITSSYPRYEGDFAGVFVKSLAETLVQFGHDIHVLAAYDPDIASNFGNSDAKMHYFSYTISRNTSILGYGRSLQSDAKLKQLAKVLIPAYLISGLASVIRLHLTEKFDAIHAHWVIPCGPIGTAASLLLKVPLVISLHGSDVFVAEHNSIYGAAARLSFLKAGAVVACSDDLRNRAVRLGASARKACTIPYGVDIERFGRHPAESELLHPFILTGQGPTILAAGRLVGKKGFDYFLRSIPLVLQRMPSARFAIIGEGDDKERLVSIAQQLNVENRLVFLGAVPWNLMPAYLSACDVFVVPSIHDPSGNVDGLPNTLLEAMAAGKPIIATRVAGIPQAISHGKDGILVTEKSPREIADAVVAILHSSQLAENLGHSAQEKARKRFSWQSAAQAYSRIYESVRQD